MSVQEIAFSFEGRKLVQRKFLLKKEPYQKENNKIEVYERSENGLELLMTIHEVWDLKRPKYALKVIPAENTPDWFVKDYLSLFPALLLHCASVEIVR